MALQELLTQPGGVAERLRSARQLAGISSAQIASKLGWGRPKVSKIERGKQLPSVSDIREWSAATGMDAATLDVLLTMRVRVDAEYQQYRHRLSGGGSVDFQRDMDHLIRSAALIRNFEPWVIPGLLQTAGYAAHRIKANSHVWGFDPGDIDATVAARIRRAEVLYEPGREFEFLLLDQVLTPLFAPPDVMLGQLDKLVTASGLPNVELGVVRVADLAVPPLTSILLLDDDRAHIEMFASGVNVGEAEAQANARIMDVLMQLASTGREARGLILAAADAIRDD